MGEKATEMYLKADLQCCQCSKKVKKILRKFPEVHDQKFDEKKNLVTIKVVSCCPEKIKKKIICKGGGCIQFVEKGLPGPPGPAGPPGPEGPQGPPGPKPEPCHPHKPYPPNIAVPCYPVVPSVYPVCTCGCGGTRQWSCRQPYPSVCHAPCNVSRYEYCSEGDSTGCATM